MNSQLYGHIIGTCSNQEEYEQLVREHGRLYMGWREYVRPLLKARRLTAQKIAAGCGVSKNSADTFNKKIPTKRRYVIMMAMMMRLNVEQTNMLLTRWAKYQELYARHPEDEIWIYLLSKGGHDRPAALFESYWKVYEEELAAFLGRSPLTEARQHKGTRILEQETVGWAMESGVMDAEHDVVFREMIRSHLSEYESGYQRLMSFLDECFERVRDTRGTANELFSDNPYFRTHYYEKMRRLRSLHELPSRNFLIVLGIRLDMDKDMIDRMLEMAGMKPLCAKDRLEGSVVFYLEELYCECPSVFFGSGKYGSDSIYYELRDCTNLGERANEADDRLIRIADDTTEEDERLHDYIRRRLEDTGIFEQDEEARVNAFLKML